MYVCVCVCDSDGAERRCRRLTVTVTVARRDRSRLTRRPAPEPLASDSAVRLSVLRTGRESRGSIGNHNPRHSLPMRTRNPCQCCKLSGNRPACQRQWQSMPCQWPPVTGHGLRNVDWDRKDFMRELRVQRNRAREDIMMVLTEIVRRSCCSSRLVLAAARPGGLGRRRSCGGSGTLLNTGAATAGPVPPTGVTSV